MLWALSQLAKTRASSLNLLRNISFSNHDESCVQKLLTSDTHTEGQTLEATKSATKAFAAAPSSYKQLYETT